VRAVLLVCSLLVLTIGGCGGGDEENGSPAEEAPTAEHEAAAPVEVELNAVNDSGMSGQATLREVEAEDGAIPTFEVEISLTPAGDGASLPAHIHNVTCAEYAKIKDPGAQLQTVQAPLSNVDDGSSKSTAAGALADRMTGEYSINVHEAASPFPAVACGDIPAHGG
jgi:hypothetical protein